MDLGSHGQARPRHRRHARHRPRHRRTARGRGRLCGLLRPRRRGRRGVRRGAARPRASPSSPRDRREQGGGAQGLHPRRGRGARRPRHPRLQRHGRIAQGPGAVAAEPRARPAPARAPHRRGHPDPRGGRRRLDHRHVVDVRLRQRVAELAELLRRVQGRHPASRIRRRPRARAEGHPRQHGLARSGLLRGRRLGQDQGRPPRGLREGQGLDPARPHGQARRGCSGHRRPREPGLRATAWAPTSCATAA